MAVYIIHFERPFYHARHYVGYAKDLRRRIRTHKGGVNNNHLMVAVCTAGIPWTVAQIYPDGTPALEKEIKRSHHTARYCPICNPKTQVNPGLPKYAQDLLRWFIPEGSES